MADSTLSNLTSLTLPSQATDLLLVGRGTARPNKVAMSDALNSAALAATTGAYGVVQLAASGGTTAGTVVQATDARLSDTRNPPDGSKGDIVVSGSGSTWTIKTNPTLSGNVTATGKITAQGTTAFPYEGQLIASNSSPSGTNSAVSQAILQAQPGYSTFVGTTGDGTAASYRTGGLGAVILDQQGYVISDAARGLLLHSINGPTIFATQNTGSEKMRLLASGTLLLGTTTDSSNGRLQLATHTASSGGIGFGTDTSLYRQAVGMLQLDHVGGSNPQFKIATSGTTRGYLRADVNGNLVVNSTGTGSVYLAFDNGTGGVVFGNGAVGAVGGVTSAGNASFNGTLSTGNNVTIRRDQAGNTSQFIDNRDTTGGEVLWFTEDGLSTEYAYIARYNSLHPTTAKRKALEFGVNGVGAYYSFAAGDVKMTGNAYSSGTRGFSRYKSANGTTAAPVEDRIVGFSNTNDLLFNVGMFAANSLTDNSSVWLRFKALDSIGNPQIGLTVTSDTVTLSPTGSGQVIIANNSGAGTATRLTLAQTGVRLFYIENTATTGNLTFGDGSGEYLRLIGSGAGTFLFGTTTNSSNGRLQLATHTASSGGIGFGTDVVLYRQAADVLKTDDCFVVSGTGLPTTTHGLELQHNGTTGYVFSYNRGTSTPLAIAINHTGGNVELAASGSHQVLVKGTGVANSTTSGALVVSGGVGIAGNTYIGGNLVVSGTITPSGGGGGGSTNVWIPASQWIPRTTNGCGVDSTETTTNRQNFDELLFDPAAIEYAQALVRMPSNYNNGTVTARFFWSSSSSTGSVVWGLQARAFADDDALDTAFGTAQTVTDTLLATGDMHISAATSAVTSGGTPAATTPLQFQIYRDATNGSDTLGSDARLLGVEISFTSV